MTNHRSIMQSIFGRRAIAYYPAAADVLGGVKPAVLFCQLAWHDASGDPFDLTYEEITDETGLTRHEIDTARSTLKDHGVVSWNVHGMPRRTFWRIHLDQMEMLLDAQFAGLPVCDKAANRSAGKRQSSLPDSGKQVRGKAANYPLRDSKNQVQEEEDSRPPIERPPKDRMNEIRKLAEDTWIEATGREIPPSANAKELGKRWWTPLRNMCDDVEWDPDLLTWVIKLTAARMNGLTYDAPDQTVKTFRSVLADTRAGRVSIPNEPRTRGAIREYLQRRMTQ